MANDGWGEGISSHDVHWFPGVGRAYTDVRTGLDSSDERLLGKKLGC